MGCYIILSSKLIKVLTGIVFIKPYQNVKLISLKAYLSVTVTNLD